MIETWFDDKHKEYFYTREPLARLLDHGDIKDQLALKERLQCKNFQWFMDNVAYDVLDKYPDLPPNVHWGEVNHCHLSEGSFRLVTDSFYSFAALRLRPAWTLWATLLPA